MRNKFLILFTAFIFGILAFQRGDYILFSAVYAALFLFCWSKKSKSLAAFTLIFFILGVQAAFMHRGVFTAKYEKIGSMKRLYGYVVEKNEGSLLIRNFPGGFTIIGFPDKELKVSVGDHIEFDYELRKLPKHKMESLYSKGINASVKIHSSSVKVTGRKNILMLPFQLKNRINTALQSIDKDGGAFTAGILSGYDSELSEEDKTNFDSLGISHILAVSGFNLGIIYLFLSRITGKINARLRYIITLGVCFLYSLMTGFEPSIFRAFVMIAILIFAKLLNRNYDVLHGVTLSALVMLVYNAYYINNIGFILSYSATYGIIILSRELKEKLPEKLGSIREEASVGISAFLWTFPIVIWFRGYISLISILVNILIGPLIAFLTVLGFSASVLYTILGTSVIFYPVVFIGNVFLSIIDFVSNLNIQLFTGQPGIIFIVLYYFFLLFTFGFISMRSIKLDRRRISALLFLSVIFTLFYRSSELKIHFIDVGQGDSIFIETPDRRAILIDTGPEYMDYSASRSKVLPYIRRKGYNRIDLLLLTHLHLDHAGGLDYLMNNIKVDRVVLHELPNDKLNSSLQVSKGDRIQVGDVVMDVLYPEKGIMKNEDKNENCIVLRLSYRDFTMLLTADAESEVMDELAGDYDVFKVSHHGSLASFSYGMLSESTIGTAVISVGKNSFGHPAKEVINALESNGIKVYRTDINGDITIMTRGKGYRVSTVSD